jgi:coenzyme F420-0:L-glutamate ligase/coenzyme F420-1:gamma-L-glutamate ligase
LAVSLIALPGMALVREGDDLAALIVSAAVRNHARFISGDVLAVAQKIVSKAEGRLVRLADVTPGARARELATQVNKDPRLVEVILAESKRVVRAAPNMLIMEHRLGFVMANAGVDQSNVGQANVNADGEVALLLPVDPDASAARLKSALEARSGVALGVVVTDSFGRPWRNGVVGVALGAAGLPALLDKRGAPDLFGRPLRMTEIALADEIASAASLVMGAAAEGIPAVIARGLALSGPERPARALIRDAALDLFR